MKFGGYHPQSFICSMDLKKICVDFLIFCLSTGFEAILLLVVKKAEILGSCKVKSLSRVLLFATPWTIAYQAPLSLGFSRQEYGSGLPFHSLADLPDPGIEPRSPILRADALPSEPL